ncbi:desulfoferrodoxin family protein [Nannocystis pusilla]|uniref:desulfoferrodoxin family protein n=1 Tax=Nannocystis pusilla TaxID=889268 RepID=UPI003B7ADA34
MATVFVLPGCAEEDAASSPNPVNAEWESKAAELEAMGEGIYSADDEMDLPGKGATHIPQVAVAGRKVTVTTTHVMSVEADHFIQYHYVRDQADVIIAMQEYVLGTDLAATMTFVVPEGTTRFTVYQYCNLHWTWSAEEQSAPA